MKFSRACYVLPTIGIVEGMSSTKLLDRLTLMQLKALRPAQIRTEDASYEIGPLVNRNGWVNPEDLASMPQCIAQQDHTEWLNAMTRCTHRQCTRHFGVICTHHQWLTELSCLSIGFSPSLISMYLPFCSRSILAKSQLIHWIRTITGRTWLVEVGDTNGLYSPSPMSLAGGYTTVGVISKAPTCLVESIFDPSAETFQHVIASCSFTSDTQHTGNAARPWEYRESQHTMVALDFETAGYDLTGYRVAYGDYLDKRCFCEMYRTGMSTEPCLESGLSLTRERLWLNATCGPQTLPADWTKGLQTTTYAYIPMENWRWPDCVTDMPNEVIGLVDRCTTDACELDAEGYCNIRRAVDRACFCRSMSYERFQGPCHKFEARINLVGWLQNVCGEVAGWHGLPKHWRQLAAPTTTEMIPGQFIITPSNPGPRHSRSASMCTSTKWKLGFLVLINLATLFAGLYSQTARHNHECPQSWLLHGLAIAALQFAANWINAALVQATAGYESVSTVQLSLLWCTIPRLTWLTMLFVIRRPFQRASLHTVWSFVFAEVILQALSARPMMQTINYGLQHRFYSNGMARLEGVPASQYVYLGAAMWLVVMVVTSALLLQAAHQTIFQPEPQASGLSPPITAKNFMSAINEQWVKFEEMLAHCWLHGSCEGEERPLAYGSCQAYAGYGTIPTDDQEHNISLLERRVVRLALIAGIGMLLLWIAQWIFWTGFILLSLNE